MDNNQLIVIKQLPEIAENLKTVSTDIEKRLETAKSLICTEENVKEIKNVRTTMRKEFTEFETKRKEVKEKVFAPYNEFEKVYKECISDKYKKADTELKTKIDDVENELKKQKEQEIKDYFEEYRQSKEINFIKWEETKIKVGLSDSKKSLKERVKGFIDKIVDDLNLIETQEHKEEILVEYKQSLNVSQSITTVTNRFKAIEEERKRQEEIVNKRLEEQTKATKEALDRFIPESNEEILQSPKIERKQEEVLTLRFTVKATRPKLRELKQFLENGGYDYE